jgi:hypothetical protein
VLRKKLKNGVQMRSQRLFFISTFYMILALLVSCSRSYGPEDIAPSGELKTVFEYPKSVLVPIAVSAKTTDAETGKLVAKAEFIRFSNRGIVIKETHYGPSGEVIFTCESEFDTAGHKIKEINPKGRKVFEVYSFWPTFSHWRYPTW